MCDFEHITKYFRISGQYPTIDSKPNTMGSENDVAILEPELRILLQRGSLARRLQSFSDVLVLRSDDERGTSDRTYFQGTLAKTDASQTYSMCNDIDQATVLGVRVSALRSLP